MPQKPKPIDSKRAADRNVDAAIDKAEPENMQVQTVAEKPKLKSKLANWLRTNKADKYLIEQNQILAQQLEALQDQTWENRENEEIHRSLAEAFGDVVLHRATDGKVIFSNKHFDRYFGPKYELPELHRTESSDNKNVDAPSILQTSEIELDTRQGKRWFSWTDLVIRDEKTGEAGLRSVARDITERKSNEADMREALEKAEIANEAKSGFLAMVSHEIRTPLNGVLGMAQLLRQTKMDAAQNSYVEAISTSGKSLLGLIEDLLDTARIESGQMELHKRPTNLHRLVEDVAEMVGPRAREKNVDIATFIQREIPESVMVDPDRLRQILLNLAGNAVKFTEKGGVGIFLELQTVKEKNHIIFGVVDTGPGMTKEDCISIFDEFTQASTGATRAHEGAGLGLSISRQLAHLMGGFIHVKSMLNKGTAFRLAIPVEGLQPVGPELPKPKTPDRVYLMLRRTPALSALKRTIQALGFDPRVIESRRDIHTAQKDDQAIAFIVDKAMVQKTNFKVEDCNNPAFLLGDAHDRHINGDRLARYAGWLTWPVRAGTLKRVISGRVKVQAPSIEPDQNNLHENELNVLLTEDNPINAMLAKSLITKLGHTVEHAENGKQAVEYYRRSFHGEVPRPDIVFMDLHMPELDGSGAIEQIREFEVEKNLPPVKIVVLSADGQSSVRDAALSIGADDFLLKPMDFEAVENLLNVPGSATQN